MTEELKYFPSQEVNVQNNSPFGRTASWINSAREFLAQSTSSEVEVLIPQELIFEAKAIIRSFASYRR